MRVATSVRIAGISIPAEKKLKIGLTYVFGIGRTTAQVICEKAKLDPESKVYSLKDDEVARIMEVISSDNIILEGDLRSEIARNIKALKDMKCYKGMRHIKRLPVRGQRTKTNARTRKGKKH